MPLRPYTVSSVQFGDDKIGWLDFILDLLTAISASGGPAVRLAVAVLRKLLTQKIADQSLLEMKRMGRIS